MDKFVIECLENMQCLRSDSDSKGTDVKVNKKLQQKEGQKKNLKSLLWEVIFYAVFLTLLVCTAFDNRDQRSYGFHSGILTAADPTGEISTISTPQEMFKWTKTQLFPFLYGTTAWDNSTLENSRRVTASLASFRLGPTRIRQHRACPESCEAPNLLWLLPMRCIPSWSSRHRDWADYDPGWTVPEEKDFLKKDQGTGNRSPWQYSQWAHVGGTPVAGRLGVYPIGGYVKDLAGTLEEVTDGLTQLQNQRWVDQWTKVVFIETTVYTPNINMFAMITAIFEFPQAMVIQAQFYTHPFRLLTYLNDYPVSARVFDFLIFIAIVWFVLRLIFKLCRWRWMFFFKFWNVLELTNLFLALAVIVLYVGRQVVSQYVAKEAAKTTGQFYNFQTLAMWDELFGILLGFCCCLSTLKVLHLFRFNRRMSLLGATIRRATRDLIGFSFMYGLIMAAFVSFSFQVFCTWVYSYSTIMGTIQSLLLLALGDLQYEQISSVNRLFAPVLITAYMALIVFILLNVLITILMDSFAIARGVIKEQANDFELLQYMARSLKFMMTEPLRKFWHIVTGSSTELFKKPDKDQGNGDLMTVSRVRDSLLCQKQYRYLKYQTKPCFSRIVRLSSKSIAESPRKPTRYFTPKAGKYLKNKSIVNHNVGYSKTTKRTLMRGISSSVNTMEENTSILLHQLDIIDQRFDRLWQLFAAVECGPPPELDTICRWREVKLTVAEVISEHLGYEDDSDEAEKDDISNVSIESDESYVEMSIAKLRFFVQRERKNMLKLETPRVFYDRESNLETLSKKHLNDSDKNYHVLTKTLNNLNKTQVKSRDGQFRNTVKAVVEHHVYLKENINVGAASGLSKEIVPLNQDDLFLDNDIYLSEDDDFIQNIQMDDDDRNKDTITYAGMVIKPDMLGKETQNQVVPSSDTSKYFYGYSKQKNIRESNAQLLKNNDAQSKDMVTKKEDKATQVDIGILSRCDANVRENAKASKEVNHLRLFMDSVRQHDLEKSKEAVPDIQIVDETKYSLKPFSLSAAENEIQRAPRYRRRNKTKSNLDSPVAVLIKRVNIKKKADEKTYLPTTESLIHLDKFNMHSERGIRPASWPEARPASSLANLDASLVLSPDSKPGISAYFPDVFNDTGYQSAGDLENGIDGFSPKNQVIPTLTVTSAAHSDPKLFWEDETSFQPINKNLLMTPPMTSFGLGSSPYGKRRLPPALNPRVQIVDENNTVSYPKKLFTPTVSPSPRRPSSLSLKSPILLNQFCRSPVSRLTPNGKSNAFAMGALAVAPQLSKRRLPTRQAQLANSGL